MTQIDLFGVETPLEELDLGPVQKLIAARARQFLDPITADEAGAIIHAHRGKHDEDTRCRYCAVDGADALRRLRELIPLEERVSGLGNGAAQADSGDRSSSGAKNEGRLVAGETPSSNPARLPSPDGDRPGYAHAGGRDTERLAAGRVMPNTGTARHRVLQLLARAREAGKTDEELSLELGLRLYTAAPRRKELLDDGWIMDSGQRRPTSTGCMAIVWTLTREARLDGRLVELLRAAA